MLALHSRWAAVVSKNLQSVHLIKRSSDDEGCLPDQWISHGNVSAVFTLAGQVGESISFVTFASNGSSSVEGLVIGTSSGCLRWARFCDSNNEESGTGEISPQILAPGSHRVIYQGNCADGESRSVTWLTGVSVGDDSLFLAAFDDPLELHLLKIVQDSPESQLQSSSIPRANEWLANNVWSFSLVRRVAPGLAGLVPLAVLVTGSTVRQSPEHDSFGNISSGGSGGNVDVEQPIKRRRASKNPSPANAVHVGEATLILHQESTACATIHCSPVLSSLLSPNTYRLGSVGILCAPAPGRAFHWSTTTDAVVRLRVAGLSHDLFWIALPVSDNNATLSATQCVQPVADNSLSDYPYTDGNSDDVVVACRGGIAYHQLLLAERDNDVDEFGFGRKDGVVDQLWLVTNFGTVVRLGHTSPVNANGVTGSSAVVYYRGSVGSAAPLHRRVTILSVPNSSLSHHFGRLEAKNTRLEAKSTIYVVGMLKDGSVVCSSFASIDKVDGGGCCLWSRVPFPSNITSMVAFPSKHSSVTPSGSSYRLQIALLSRDGVLYSSRWSFERLASLCQLPGLSDDLTTKDFNSKINMHGCNDQEFVVGESMPPARNGRQLSLQFTQQPAARVQELQQSVALLHSVQVADKQLSHLLADICGLPDTVHSLIQGCSLSVSDESNCLDLSFRFEPSESKRPPSDAAVLVEFLHGDSPCQTATTHVIPLVQLSGQAADPGSSSACVVRHLTFPASNVVGGHMDWFGMRHVRVWLVWSLAHAMASRSLGKSIASTCGIGALLLRQSFVWTQFQSFQTVDPNHPAGELFNELVRPSTNQTGTVSVDRVSAVPDNDGSHVNNTRLMVFPQSTPAGLQHQRPRQSSANLFAHSSAQFVSDQCTGKGDNNLCSESSTEPVCSLTLNVSRRRAHDAFALIQLLTGSRRVDKPPSLEGPALWRSVIDYHDAKDFIAASTLYVEVLTVPDSSATSVGSDPVAFKVSLRSSSPRLLEAAEYAFIRRLQTDDGKGVPMEQQTSLDHSPSSSYGVSGVGRNSGARRRKLLPQDQKAMVDLGAACSERQLRLQRLLKTDNIFHGNADQMLHNDTDSDEVAAKAVKVRAGLLKEVRSFRKSLLNRLHL